MRIAVIDDEKYSRVALVRQIENFLPHAEIFEAGSGAQAVELLEKHTFDILFLDIHLGDMEGTTIAALARRLCRRQRSSSPRPTPTMPCAPLSCARTTTCSFNPDRIREALKRCTAEPSPAVSAAPPVLHRIAVNSNRSTTLLDTDEITYIETDGIGRGCILHTISGKSYPDTTSLGEYESRLGEQDFYRIHKTCLVHLRYIVSIFPWTGNSFVLRVRGTDSVLPISRELRRRLNI